RPPPPRTRRAVQDRLSGRVGGRSPRLRRGVVHAHDPRAGGGRRGARVGPRVRTGARRRAAGRGWRCRRRERWHADLALDPRRRRPRRRRGRRGAAAGSVVTPPTAGARPLDRLRPVGWAGLVVAAALAASVLTGALARTSRSEERRAGQEGRSRW